MKPIALRTFIVLMILVASRLHQSFAGLEVEKPKYAERWALVVGINYESAPPESRLKLQRAQEDAIKFHKLLLSNYGFTDDKKAILLIGDEAKKSTIEDKIEDICNQASKDACVIIYFSGHGFARTAPDAKDTNAPGHGELFAADIKFTDNLPRASTVVEMKTLCERLEKCSARHKLLILDCCHSGSVFSAGGRGAAAFDAKRVDDSVFRSPGFQAMTASRDTQKASDGSNGSENSPFTDALLQALKNIPATQKKDQPFTTTELFTGMQWYLDRNLKESRDQSPRCSWLDGGQGELHFFPEGIFPDPEVPDDREQKVMLAMVPGSFDHWWFEETPWFMPGLRYEVVALEELERSSTLDMISPLRLEQAANETRNKLDGDKRQEVQRRLRDFDKLFRAKDDEGTWDQAVSEVREGLQALVDKPADKPADASTGKAADPALEADLAANVDPVDLHFLAVLEQASREKDVELHKQIQGRATGHYKRAIALYKDQAEHSRASKPLLALCLADRGLYASTVDRKYEDACEYFKQARSVFGSLTPPPFQVYVLCREAEALAKLGRRGEARKRIDEAYAAALTADPLQNSTLTAALHHRHAWMQMEWCTFPEAIVNFTRSTKILEELAKTDHEAAIMCMHNHHGIAMATRYQGDSGEALNLYRGLLEDQIYARLTLMRDRIGRESNYRQVKSRLTERWVNAMERAADCSLFGSPMDVPEAVDDYRRALRAANYLPRDKAMVFERKIRQKMALALVLANSNVQDLDRAADQLTEIGEVTKQMPTNLKKPETSLVIRDRLVRLLLNYCRSLTPCGTDSATPAVEDMAKSETSSSEPASTPDPAALVDETPLLEEPVEACAAPEQLAQELDALRTRLKQLARANFLDSSLARDDIETAMFALRVIIEDLPDPTELTDSTGEDRVTRLKDIELLLEYCRLGRSGGPGAIHFVRPYYDTAIAALIKLKPKDSKQLLEVAWEATRGKLHFKPRGDQTTLLLYCGKSGNYFFLDVPHGTSAFYGIDPSANFDRILAASNGDTGSSEQLALPADLRKELFAVDGTVSLCWRDQVRALGIDNPAIHVTADQIEPPEVAASDESSQPAPGPAPKFPFVLPATVQVTDVPLEVPKTFVESEAPSDASASAVDGEPAVENASPGDAAALSSADKKGEIVQSAPE